MAVTPATIATALGVAAPDSGSAEFAQWSMWIADALMLINGRNARLNDPVLDLDPDVLDYVVREAVTAKAQRPDSATQVTISVDDASTSKTYRSSTGRVTILDEWWELLGLGSGSGNGPYSVDTVACSSVHSATCSLAFGALYCSCGASIAGFPIFGDE